MVWSATDTDESEGIDEIISTSSDRAAAIVAASILEDRLKDTLKRSLRDHQINKSTSIWDRMFGGSLAPLGSFSAKIDMGFMIGLYNAGSWADLNEIRLIRNAFAHEPTMRDFKVDRVRSRSMNLKEFEKHVSPRGGPLPALDAPAKLIEGDLPEQLSDPRKRYLLCVRFYLLALSIHRVFIGTPRF